MYVWRGRNLERDGAPRGQIVSERETFLMGLPCFGSKGISPKVLFRRPTAASFFLVLAPLRLRLSSSMMFVLSILTGCILLLINITESFHGVIPNRNRHHVHRLATTTSLTADAVNAYLVALGTKKEDTRVTIKKQPSGFCAVASTDIKKGECLISIPLGICLDAKKANERFGPIVSRLRTGEYGMLALLLLSEKALGDSSKYATYINCLPDKAPGILSWSETQIQELVKSTTRNVQDQLDAIGR